MVQLLSDRTEGHMHTFTLTTGMLILHVMAVEHHRGAKQYNEVNLRTRKEKQSDKQERKKRREITTVENGNGQGKDRYETGKD